MSNIDKRSVQAVADLKAGYILGHADVAILNELARIALASLEAEESVPYELEETRCDGIRKCIAALRYHHKRAETCSNGYTGSTLEDDTLKSINFLKSTNTAPAPVSVPDDVSGPLAHAYKELTPTFMRNHIDVFERYGIYPDGSAGIQAMRIALDGMTRRAAMLQGAKPVTTAYKLPFEQWLSQQTGTIDVECGCVMTEVFFHWLRVAYEAGNSPVIPDGWVILPAEPTQGMMNAWLSEVANWRGHAAGYRAMIAAAPQQEAKNV
ncbi:Uncharacterised protein [Enterobacter hormaechei]|uniref:hypothetical protein n=1 Tax=Enterobacter hormaechei TaxID=158836 RepID=UPI00125199F9|nr:hypothetical protein [Enterobacter hormaechei]VAF98107.1 Uncharacterised protein [Enterobacter hormaechei]